jgi:O-antigen/teichoic acid export membrane protein
MSNTPTNQQNTQANSVITNSITNTVVVVIYGILTKGVSLFFTILLARIISKDAYGLAKIYLEFIYLIILYFPRETIRKTAQKYCPHKLETLEEEKFKEVIQLCWLLTFAFNFLSIPIFYLFINYTPNLINIQLHVFLYVLCANLELLVEPIVLYGNLKFDNKNKLISLTLSNYTRLAANYFICYLFAMDLWSFTLSRLLATVIYCGYMIYIGVFQYKMSLSALSPSFLRLMAIYKENKELMEIFFSFIRINAVKTILTYTERMILSFFLTFSEAAKAEYSFITDNFSLIVKYVLEPVEENFFNFVNKIKNYNEEREEYSKHMLQKYLRIVLIFGTLLIGYIYVIGKESITFVYTNEWSTESSIDILRLYSIYIAICSINGILEAHSNAIFTPDQLNKYNTIMVIKTFKLIVVSILLSRIDIKGLIYANVISMVIRILVNLYITFNGNLREMIIFIQTARYKSLTLLVTLSCLTGLFFTKEYIRWNFFKVAFGGCVFLTNVLAIYKIEKNNITDILKAKTE